MSAYSNLLIDDSEKLVVKASCDHEYDMIMVFNDILVEDREFT